MTFEHFGFNKKILNALAYIGFETPMPVQKKVIPVILNKKSDLVCLAQTGTGKTAAFGLPMINLTNFSLKKTQGLVICPTRELCTQVASALKTYSTHISKNGIVALYGGMSISKQIFELKNGAQIIVATPGRFLDLIRRKAVDLSSVTRVVLDEADEMLSMGFREDINTILHNIPPDRMMWFFSATMPLGVKKIVNEHMKNPIEVSDGPPNQSVATIKHLKYVMKDKFRYAALKRIIYYHPQMFGLVFCRTRKESQLIVDNLIKDKINAGALNGDLSQNQRNTVMNRFRSGELAVLVATDVAARGLDIDNISHVIHYNIPNTAENYTHRSGRTGRAGRSGVSIVLVNNHEQRKLLTITKRTGAKFIRKRLPIKSDVIQKQVLNIVEQIISVKTNPDDEKINVFLPSIYDKLSSFTREELIRKFVYTQVNEILSFNDNIIDIPRKNENKLENESRLYRKQRYRCLQSGTTQFVLNIGSNNKINKGTITRLICNRSGISSKQIGKIAINKSNSYFETEKDVSEFVLKSMKGARIDGYSVKISNTNQKSNRRSKIY